MRLLMLTLTVIGAGLATVDGVRANEFWHRVHIDRMRVNCWPEPFYHDDRDLVRMPLVAMMNRGWQLQNTISDHLFHADDQSLTQAGKYKLRWILTQAPPHRRTVYVLRSTTAAETANRLAAVRNFVDGVVEEGPGPEVLVTDIAPPGGAGDYFDQVDRQLKASIPAPRLPSRTGIVDAGG
jgi:hypothetical protein